MKIEAEEEPIDVETSTFIINNSFYYHWQDQLKGIEEVLLWMVVGEKMVHGDKLKSPSYDSLSTKYVIVYQCIFNVYSQNPHPGRPAGTMKRKLEEDISTP